MATGPMACSAVPSGSLVAAHAMQACVVHGLGALTTAPHGKSTRRGVLADGQMALSSALIQLCTMASTPLHPTLDGTAEK
jgi:hypothetical protein